MESRSIPQTAFSFHHIQYIIYTAHKPISPRATFDHCFSDHVVVCGAGWRPQLQPTTNHPHHPRSILIAHVLSQERYSPIPKSSSRSQERTQEEVQHEENRPSSTVSTLWYFIPPPLGNFSNDFMSVQNLCKFLFLHLERLRRLLGMLLLLPPPPFDEKSNAVLVLFSGKGNKTVGKRFTD